jgi:outer membrane immunogenic protein
MRAFAIGSVVGSVLLAGASAQAADLRMPVKAAPVVVPAFNWTGFYIGGHLGGIWGDSRFDEVTGPVFPAFALAPPPFIIIFPARIGTIPGATASDESFMGGGQLGFNWQAGHFLFGVEADVSGMRLRENATVIPTSPFTGGQVITGTYTTQIDWMASLRGRVGLAFDRLLIYATGGAAFADAQVNTSFTLTQPPGTLAPPGGTTAARASLRNIGWTLGGGIEWAIWDAWSLAAEYRHSDFGREAIALASTDPAGALAPLTTNVRLTTDQATLRLNYRFGGR